MTAKATLIPGAPAVTEVIVKVPEQPAKVVLELTMEQAETLAIIFRHIGGPTDTRRGHVDSMSQAIQEAGIDIRPLFKKKNNLMGTSYLFSGNHQALCFVD